MATVINTYARAFADVVMDKKLDAQRTLEEAKQIVALADENPVLREVWDNPSIPVEQKRGVLDGIVQRAGLSQPVRNFMAVLIDKGRTRLLPEIVAQFAQDLNQRLGIAEAQITTARPLNKDEQATLESDLTRVTGNRIRATYDQDAAVLGGAIARVGGTIYDGSVKGQLERIRKQLVNN